MEPLREGVGAGRRGAVAVVTRRSLALDFRWRRPGLRQAKPRIRPRTPRRRQRSCRIRPRRPTGRDADAASTDTEGSLSERGRTCHYGQQCDSDCEGSAAHLSAPSYKRAPSVWSGARVRSALDQRQLTRYYRPVSSRSACRRNPAVNPRGRCAGAGPGGPDASRGRGGHVKCVSRLPTTQCRSGGARGDLRGLVLYSLPFARSAIERGRRPFVNSQ